MFSIFKTFLLLFLIPKEVINHRNIAVITEDKKREKKHSCKCFYLPLLSVSLSIYIYQPSLSLSALHSLTCQKLVTTSHPRVSVLVHTHKARTTFFMALRCLLKSPTTSSYISKVCTFLPINLVTLQFKKRHLVRLRLTLLCGCLVCIH